MAALRLTKASVPYVAAMLLAFAAGPAAAHHCKGAHFNPVECGGGGGDGGGGTELEFVGYLVGDLAEVDLPFSDPVADSCEPVAGPNIFIDGVETPLPGITDFLVDQAFGTGPFTISQRDKMAAWIFLRGKSNRVTLPGPDGSCAQDPNPVTTGLSIQVFFMRDQECGAADPTPVCITGYQVWAKFGEQNKTGSSTVLEQSLTVPVVDGSRTVVRMARRFEIFQQGQGELYGTLSYGTLVLCPLGEINDACAAEFLP